MENSVQFESEGLLLEGLLEKNDTEKAIIITHPHPLYGGEMHNAVVSAMKDAFADKGFSTLRFNFRGTGYSQGKHDDGIGEKKDVVSAIAFLVNEGFREINLAGYSFGAWVNLMATASEDLTIESLFLISPPVDFIEFEPVSNISPLKLVVAGDRDEYASFPRIQTMAPDWNSDAAIERISGGDHFYSGCLDTLKKIIYNI